MIPVALSAGLAVATATLAPPLVRIAGIEPRVPLVPTSRRFPADLLRVFVALAAVALVVGGASGDVLVAGCLAAAAIGRRDPAAGLTLVLVAAVAAVRSGSGALDEIAGTHAVLGPAAFSPHLGVSGAAMAASAAALISAAAALPAPALGGPGAVRTPAAVADSLAAVVAVCLGLAVSFGPILADGVSAPWAAWRLAGLAAAFVTSAFVARLARIWRGRVALTHVGAILAALSLGVSLATR